MTPLADPLTAPFRVTETSDRITAIGADDIEICGAYKPVGMDCWQIYATVRLTEHQHHVYARTAQVARWHVGDDRRAVRGGCAMTLTDAILIALPVIPAIGIGYIVGLCRGEERGYWAGYRVGVFDERADRDEVTR